MSDFNIEAREQYFLIQPTTLSEDELEDLNNFIEKILMESRKHVVLSLKNIETIFSLHLTSFIQIYKMVNAINCRFFITDISSAVQTVMEMTQLDTLVLIYKEYVDFLERADLSMDTIQPAFDFSMQKMGSDAECFVSGVALETNIDEFIIELQQMDTCFLNCVDLEFISVEALKKISDQDKKISCVQLRRAAVELIEEKAIGGFELQEA